MKFKPRCVSDKQLMKVPVKENNEKLVNLRNYNKEIVIEIEKESRKIQNLKKDECFIRESVAIMLSQAQSLFPKGLFLKVVDGYRPMEAQKKIYKQVFLEMKNKFPNLSNKEIETETDKFVANPKIIPPHTTGGAVDLTIVDKKLKELDFGTKVNEISEKSATKFPFKSKEIVRNRKLLIKIMRKVGFVNYPLEWWHWDFGDRIWGFYKKKTSIYNSV